LPLIVSPRPCAVEHGQGLPQNSIYAIIQTRDGYHWIGARVYTPEFAVTYTP